MRYRVGLLLLAALAGPLVPNPASAQKDGENDNSFWSGGKHAFTASGTSLYLRGLTVAPDGVLVRGASWTDGVWHSNWRAVGDSSLGTLCNIDLPNYEEFSVKDVKFDAQGRLLVVGQTAVHAGDTVNISFVARYSYPSCTLDGTFSGDGWTVLSWSSEFAVTGLVQIMVQPDGKLLLAGFGFESGELVATPIVFRLLPDGSLDSSFSFDGRSRAPFEQGQFWSAALAPNGSIVMAINAGGPNVDFGVVLFTADGTYKSTSAVPFDLVPNGSDLATSIAVGADGRVYVSGRVQGAGATSLRAGVVALRFLPNGFLVRDLGFAGDGRLDFVLNPGTYSEIWGSVVQDDGKLVVVGRFSNDNDQAGAMAVARVLPSGSLDPKFFPTSFTFGLRLVEFDLGGTDEDAASDVVLQRGRIVLGGSAELASGDSAVALARLHNALLFADAFETGDLRQWRPSSP